LVVNFCSFSHQASKRGVTFIAQTGGSVQDESVTAAADEYNMVMTMTGVRLFHH
jgi:AICAR transformylase/IMP cyclohydrolase PurH